ncbi:MAG: hypothetical protein IPG45_20465 [Deltaproteobacteria bacterium]|nr:hypothetical protein [Deltaproteobacteria bacterium]
MYFVVDPENIEPELDETNNRTGSWALNNGLRAVPAQGIHFGPVCRGQSASSSLRLSNVNDEDLTISAIDTTLESSGFTVGAIPLPLTLTPGETREVAVRFDSAPGSTGEQHLRIDWSAAACPLVVTLSALPLESASFQDPFRVDPAALDVLVVIDNSPSLIDQLADLETNLVALHDRLYQQPIDFHLGVITTHGLPGALGHLRRDPHFIQRSTPEGPLRWLEAINVATATIGVNQSFDATSAALSPTLLGTSNIGFLREDTALLVIYVADNDDDSDLLAEPLAQQLTRLKADPASVLVNAIVGVGPGSACATPGTRYAELANRTGGVVQDICSPDWSAAFEVLPQLSPTLQYSLSTRWEVAPSSLIVASGVQRLSSSDYVFDPAKQSLMFDPAHRPPVGSWISASYQATCR